MIRFNIKGTAIEKQRKRGETFRHDTKHVARFRGETFPAEKK